MLFSLVLLQLRRWPFSLKQEPLWRLFWNYATLAHYLKPLYGAGPDFDSVNRCAEIVFTDANDSDGEDVFDRCDECDEENWD